MFTEAVFIYGLFISPQLCCVYFLLWSLQSSLYFLILSYFQTLVSNHLSSLGFFLVSKLFQSTYLGSLNEGIIHIATWKMNVFITVGSV